jgi:hypothetical protein
MKTRGPMLIIRPSGVWNSRSPLHNLFHHSLLISRDYSILTLAVTRLRYGIDHQPNGSAPSARTFLKVNSSGQAAMRAWPRYRDSWRALCGKYEDQPTLVHVKHDMGLGLYAIRESAIARLSAAFETFVQCWGLNMLLAKLESGGTLTDSETRLAHDFSPLRQRPLIPIAPRVLTAFPTCDSALSALPHITTDYMSGQPVQEAVSPILNAKSAILFWRDFRNHIVHRGGFVSHAFADRHSPLFDELRRPYGETLRPMEPGSRLQLPDVIFAAVASTHMKCALWLNTHLQACSSRRGRVSPEGSDEAEPSRFDTTIQSKPLLRDGDHTDSLRWLRDETWRTTLLAEWARKGAEHL